MGRFRGVPLSLPCPVRGPKSLHFVVLLVAFIMLHYSCGLLAGFGGGVRVPLGLSDFAALLPPHLFLDLVHLSASSLS